MNYASIKKVCLLVIFLTIMFPMSATAVVKLLHFDVSPGEWDFGDVEVGSSSTAIFTITSIDDSEPKVITSIEITNNTSDAFVILSPVPPIPGSGPIILWTYGDYSDVIVGFSPSSLGSHSADLHFITFDGDFTIPIQGIGVPEEEPPGELMIELINSFYEGSDNGTLIGSGPGSSASGRLKAFGNMLKAASDLINAGEYESACIQLRDSLNRVDGYEPPPDFVTGPSANELMVNIAEVLIKLGCF